MESCSFLLTLYYSRLGVHGSIEMCPLTKELIDTPQMQRLAGLKQLGATYLTYRGATHTRFEHSLGVMHLAGMLLETIIKKQKKLNVTPKDIACVRIAGLLHDIGHGPFSHTYELFLEHLKNTMKKGSFMGQKFDTERTYKDFHDYMEGWAHEDASLMMIDALLGALGLEIDESNLDGPLKQVGDGIDASLFGIDCDEDNDDADEDDDESEFTHDNMPLPLDRVLTSRDWIFIKECIVGGRLPPKGMSIKKFKQSNCRVSQLIGRPDPNKEFLYDIVSNRHSGLDVDKMDYLARDTLRCHGTNVVSAITPRLIEKAFVAWGECSDVSNCWKCQRNPYGPKTHLMMYVHDQIHSLT